MLTLAIPQSEPLIERNFLHFVHIGEKIEDASALSNSEYLKT